MIRPAHLSVRAMLEASARGLTDRVSDHSHRSAFACERARIDVRATGISRSIRTLPRIAGKARVLPCDRPDRARGRAAFLLSARTAAFALPVPSDPAGTAMARG